MFRNRKTCQPSQTVSLPDVEISAAVSGEGKLVAMDRKHRGEMLVAFGVPAVGMLIYVVSLLVNWVRSVAP